MLPCLLSIHLKILPVILSLKLPNLVLNWARNFTFGPPETTKTISSWLKTLSRRALITVQSIGGNLHSILVAYRLLQEQPDWPVESLCKRNHAIQ